MKFTRVNLIYPPHSDQCHASVKGWPEDVKVAMIDEIKKRTYLVIDQYGIKLDKAEVHRPLTFLEHKLTLSRLATVFNLSIKTT